MRAAAAFAVVCTGFLGLSCASQHAANVQAQGHASRAPELGTNATAKDDSFVLGGYVVDSYHCPPCPKQSDCEACVDSLIVSNQRQPASIAMTADGNLRVLVPSATRFSLGSYVRLRVAATPAQPFQNDPCCSRIGPYIVRWMETL